MNMPTSRKHSQGLTMIEVLITLIILSVGLLGMAAMQLTGIRSANGASYRTQATLLVNDMVERMRANPAALNANDFLAINSTDGDIDCDNLPAVYCGEYFNGDENVNAQTCTTTQMATYDVNVWFCGVASAGARQGGVQALLPQATATINCNDALASDTDNCTNNSPHTVTVSWAEPNPQRGGDATIQQSVSITIQP